MNLPNSPLQLHASRPPTGEVAARPRPREKASEADLVRILTDKKSTIPAKLLQVFEHLHSTGVVSKELLQTVHGCAFDTGEDIPVNIVQ